MVIHTLVGGGMHFKKLFAIRQKTKRRRRRSVYGSLASQEGKGKKKMWCLE